MSAATLYGTVDTIWTNSNFWTENFFHSLLGLTCSIIGCTGRVGSGVGKNDRELFERHGHYCITGTDSEETISNH